MALSVLLAIMVLLSLIRDRGNQYHMVIMIAIAAYAFARITFATVNLIKSRHSRSAKTVALRSISFADGVASIFALQRSMLVSFEGMTESEILLMNTLTGCAVCLIVFLLGHNLLGNKKLLFKPAKDLHKNISRCTFEKK